MAAKKGSLKLWDFLVVFALVYLGSQFAFSWFFPKPAPATPYPLSIEMQDSSMRLGVTPILVITNNTDADITLTDRCPLPPIDVFRVEEGNELTDITAAETVVPCEPVEAVPAGDEIEISMGPWKQAMFAQTGLYEAELPYAFTGATAVATGSGEAVTGGADQSQYREGIITRFTIDEPGVFTKMFRAFITKPFLNALIFIASYTPGHNLGVAIIILTLAVKLLLFIPTQHALEGQKKMMLLQPKFEALKRQYADNPQKMQEETMKVWKENKVNPLQSCLPLLVQFPVLIGLFYVIREGSHLELSRHLLYPFYENLGWTFGTQFLGFDLSESYPWVFPPLLVVLQFVQMKLSFHISDKKKAKELKEKTTAKVDTTQEVQQKVMTYALPLMIGFFAINYPSALSLYWGVSTVFAIVQQLIVNREHIRA